MNWLGKVGGGVLGFLAGGPIGLVIGGLLGHQFDRGLASQRPLRRRRRPQLDPHRESGFFESLFLVMGHLAKADGRVSEEEIAAARQIMRQLKLQGERLRTAQSLFNRGKRPDFALAAQLSSLRQACAGEPPLARAFVQLQLDFLLAKGHLHRRQRELLAGVAAALAIGRLEFTQMEAVARAQRRFGQRGAAAGQAGAGNLARAFRTLGLEPSASDSEVRQAYRRLINRYHPDKQQARGGSVHELSQAEQRTREIRKAWELIREQRGIR